MTDSGARLLETLLRGLSHALSNRVTVLEVIAGDVADASPAALPELQREVARLGAMNRSVRAVLDDGAREEPLDLRDVVDAAAELVASCGPSRMPPVVVEGEAPAVREVRWQLVREVAALLLAGDDPAASRVVTLSGDEGEGRIVVRVGDAPPATLRMPTLAERRRRERPRGPAA